MCLTISRNVKGISMYQEKIQPCITYLLSPSAELIEPIAVNSDTIEVPFQSVKSKKRKRSQKSGENLDINPNKKSSTKTPEKMSDPEPNPKDPVINNNSDGVELSPELKELKKWLNTSMLININKCIAETYQGQHRQNCELQFTDRSS